VTNFTSLGAEPPHVKGVRLVSKTQIPKLYRFQNSQNPDSKTRNAQIPKLGNPKLASTDSQTGDSKTTQIPKLAQMHKLWNPKFASPDSQTRVPDSKTQDLRF